MQFYKFEGFTVDAKWSEENDNRRVMREKVRKVSMKSNSFNQHQQRKAYLFVTDASEDTVTIGIIIKNFCDVLNLTSEYLKEIEIDLKDTYIGDVHRFVVLIIIMFGRTLNFINSPAAVLLL